MDRNVGRPHVDDDEDVYLYDEEPEGDAVLDEAPKKRFSVPKPSMPSISMPRIPFPSISIPEPMKGVLGIFVVIMLFFGPHTWIVSQNITENELFGDFQLGQVPELDGLLNSDFSSSGATIPDGELGDLLAGLPEPSEDEIPAYDRELFMSGWTDVNGSGCTTREDILMEAFENSEVGGCSVIPDTGEAVSMYDDVVMESPADVDIEHVVALQDMWLSGAWDWSDELRSEAAQDTINLIAVTAASNRAKGALGPDEWEPPAGGEATCEYTEIYVTVKAAYELSVTDSQRDALARNLESCSNEET